MNIPNRAGRDTSPSLCVQPLCWPWLFAILMLHFQGFSFFEGAAVTQQCLVPAPLFSGRTSPPPTHTVAAALSHKLHLCQGHSGSCCLQACPSIHRAVLTLPFCLLFTSFQICPFCFSPHCCLQDSSISRMVSGHSHSRVSSVGVDKTLLVPR